MTDASGNYTITGLPAGDYKVQFSDCNWPPVYAPEWYNDKPGPGAANLVHVDLGVGTPDIDEQLGLPGSISGTVTDAVTGDPIPNICVAARTAEDWWLGFTQTDASGNYTIGWLTTGDYKVEFYDCMTGVYIGEWYNDKPDFDSADIVHVNSGADTGGIDAALSTEAPLAVTVRVGSGTVTPGGTITLPVEIIGAPAPGVAGVSVEAQFDPAVLDATGCTKDPNGVYGSGACNPDFDNDGAYPDSAKCVAVSASGVAGDSVVCEVTFGTVCQTGDTLTVHPVVEEVIDPDGNPISYAVEDGTITCGLPGDVNCDSAVDVIDALFVLQYDVGLRSGSDQCPPPTGALYQSAGDVNCDDAVDVIDALFILQYDVGLTPNVPPGCPGPGGGFASPTATAALQQDRRPLNT